MTRARNISRILSAQEISGDINLSGIVTATDFYGSGANLTGIAVTSDVSTSSLVVVGISTLGNVTAGVATATQFVGNISGTAATFTGNVTVGGTLTYDDVTNIDSIGLVTARNGLQVTGGIATVTGQTNLANVNVSGISTFQNNIVLGDGDGGYPRIIMGNSSDFYIYHSSVDGNILQDVGANGVQIWSNSLTVKDSSVTNTGLLVQPNSSTEIYYNNFKKFETTSSGIIVTGIATITNGIGVSSLLKEEVNITAGKLSDNTNIDLENGMVHYFTTTETTTSTPNIRYSSSESLDSKMSVGQSVVVTLITTAAAGAYSANITIDGGAVTENWIGGSAPSDGGSSGVDIHTFTIIKTASATFTVIGNQSKTS